MKHLLLLLLLVPSLSLSAQLLTESDKQRHFAAGAVFGSIAYGIVLEQTENKTQALLASIAGAVAAGYVKEITDKRKGYGFDDRDLLATALGGFSIGITLDIFVAPAKKKQGLFNFKKRNKKKYRF